MLILVERFYSEFWKTWLKKLTPDFDTVYTERRYSVGGVPGGYHPAFNIRIHEFDCCSENMDYVHDKPIPKYMDLFSCGEYV